MLGDWFHAALIPKEVTLGHLPLRLIFSVQYLVVKLLLENLRVLRVIHLFNDPPPHPFFNYSRLDLIKHLSNFNFNFERVLIFEQHFQKVVKSVFDMHLYEPELFVTLVFQDPPEKGHIMVFGVVQLNAVYNGNRPLDNQILEAILLVQISVNILFHCFPRLFRVFTLFIELDLLRVHVLNCVFQLF